MRKKLDPILPGEILWKEFMEPNGLSQNKLARDIDVPVTLNQRHHSRPAWNHRRFGLTVLRLFRHYGGVLAQLADTT